MRWLVVLAAMLPSAALAQVPVDVAGCKLDELGIVLGRFVTCEVTNTGSTPIATLAYGIRLVESGRTVPWGEEGYSTSRLASVAGGIEAGETVEVMFRSPSLPDRADPARVTVVVEVLEARDIIGRPIN